MQRTEFMIRFGGENTSTVSVHERAVSNSLF